MTGVTRREMLGSASALVLIGAGAARADAAPAAANTNWLHYASDLANTRYAPLDQIDAGNFDKLEVAWRFSTNAFGAQWDPYYTATPLIVNGRLYATAGFDRYAVALDGATGQLLWSYHHDERGRQGTRGGAGFGLSYWSDGQVERVLFVTRSYQLISLDAKTGLPDPAFGKNGELDLRLDFDQEVDPARAVIGLHAAPLIVRNTVVVGSAPSPAVKGYLRGFDVRTGRRKWIFHTIPRKGEVGYESWLQESQAEAAGNTGVWAPMSADEELGLVYAPVELPPTDFLGTSRQGDGLFSQTLVALDVETGERRWHYQVEHHGLWDHDIPCAPILYDLSSGGRRVKALAQPTKHGFLFVLDRTTGKPVWPIPERPVPRGNVPGEWYSPTQPMPTKPPAFDRQGFTEDDLVDFTPALKKRALEIYGHYKSGHMFTPPPLIEGEIWGTLALPGGQGGANWPGGSYDPETDTLYIFSKTAADIFGISRSADGRLGHRTLAAPPTHDNEGGGFQGRAGLDGGAVGRGGPVAPDYKDGLDDPVQPGMLSIAGIPLNKPPYGRITAMDMRRGDIAWQVAHGETPDFIRNHPMLKGLNIPRTGQAGILGTLTTRSLVVCGDGGLFTDESGRKGARLRAYDKVTGKQVGAVFMAKANTGAPMTYMLGARQYIVAAMGDRFSGGELIAYRLPRT